MVLGVLGCAPPQGAEEEDEAEAEAEEGVSEFDTPDVEVDSRVSIITSDFAMQVRKSAANARAQEQGARHLKGSVEHSVHQAIRLPTRFSGVEFCVLYEETGRGAPRWKLRTFSWP